MVAKDFRFGMSVRFFKSREKLLTARKRQRTSGSTSCVCPTISARRHRFPR